MRYSSCSLLCRSSSSFRKFSSSVFPLSNNFDLKKKERKKEKNFRQFMYLDMVLKLLGQIQTISWRVFIRRGVINTLRHQVQFCRSVSTYVIVSYMYTFLFFSFFFRSLVGNSLDLIRLSSPFRRSLPLSKFARRCDIDLLNILCFSKWLFSTNFRPILTISAWNRFVNWKQSKAMFMFDVHIP